MLREEQLDSFGNSTGKGIMDDKAFTSSKSECSQWKVIFDVLRVTSIILRAEVHKYNFWSLAICKVFFHRDCHWTSPDISCGIHRDLNE